MIKVLLLPMEPESFHLLKLPELDGDKSSFITYGARVISFAEASGAGW